MVASKKKTVTKSSAITKTLETLVANLGTARAQATAAVKASTSESKKLMKNARGLKKRRATLMSKKKRATAANKKKSTASSHKAIKSVAAELAITDKTLKQTTASRQNVLRELSGLKDALKKLIAYVKGIKAADKKMARPKRRRNKRKS